MQPILADQAYVSGQRKDDVHINTRARISPQLQERREAITETWKGIHGRNDRKREKLTISNIKRKTERVQ